MSFNFNQAMEHVAKNPKSKITIYGRTDFYVYFDPELFQHRKRTLKFPYADEVYSPSKYDMMCSWVLYIKENPIKSLLVWGFGKKALPDPA